MTPLITGAPIHVTLVKMFPINTIVICGAVSTQFILCYVTVDYGLWFDYALDWESYQR
jgi:hypothetical protein